MNTNELMVKDTWDGNEYSFDNWKAMAEFTVHNSMVKNDFDRYLPSCNGWNLDYPQRHECIADYQSRMISMAMSLGLLG